MENYCLLRSECGTGKTLAVLGSIVNHALKLQEAFEKDGLCAAPANGRSRYGCVLTICPKLVLPVWRDAIKQITELKLHIFYGSRETADLAFQDDVIEEGAKGFVSMGIWVIQA
jgi:hypothetical protein